MGGGLDPFVSTTSPFTSWWSSDPTASGLSTMRFAAGREPTGPKLEQLGWPEIDIIYRPGTRIPERATLHLRTVDRRSLQIDLESLSAIPLHFGCGYGNDPEWNHGRWMGESWRRVISFDYLDPEVQAACPGAASTIWPERPVTGRAATGSSSTEQSGGTIPPG